MSSCQEDQRRFEALYRSTRLDVLAYLARRTGDREQAADLLAETYPIAWRKLHEIPEDPRARLWLFGVARNLLRNHDRAHQSQTVLTQRLAHEMTTLTGDTSKDNQNETLRQALDELPAKEQEVILLTAWEGLAPREIASVLGTSANVVRVRLARARSKLRPQLKSRPSVSNTACDNDDTGPAHTEHLRTVS
jgi:RNA polymerase sigma-70 factor (ECF subfamily)